MLNNVTQVLNLKMKLSEMEFGAEGVVTEINTEKQKINAMGIRVGKKLKMITKQPIKGPVVSTCGELEVAMGIDLASQVVVDVD